MENLHKKPNRLINENFIQKNFINFIGSAVKIAYYN